MSHSLHTFITRKVLAGLLFVAMLFSFSVSPLQAQAQTQTTSTMTTAEMLDLIQVLMLQVAQLQLLLASQQSAGAEGGFVNPGLTLGSTVQTTDILKVRQTPSITGQLLGYQSAGAQGKVVSAAQQADGYTWYKIDYNTGADGWSALNWLRTVSVVSTTPPPTTKGCLSGGKTYPVGTQTTKLINADGTSSTVADGYYECQSDGTWKVVNTSPASNNVAAYVYETNSSAVIGSTNNGVETGKFVINFEVVADDDDVYISDNLSESMTYHINGPAKPAKQSVRLDSIADEVNGYYLVSEGEVEDFTLTVFVEPAVSGKYQLDLDAVFYTLGPATGQIYKAALDNGDTFSTSYLSLSAGGTSTKGCYNNGQYDSVGTQTTKVINANGTTNTIVDGYFECQSDGTWNKVSTYPSPAPKSGCDSGGGYLVPEGTQTTRITNPDGTLKIIADGYFECQSDGTWKTVGTYPSIPISKTAPQKNHFACDRYQSNYVEDDIACYGMWDYGNDFGGDVDMCGSYGAGTIGCQKQAPVCHSGLAEATVYYGNSKLSGAKLTEIASNLRVTETVAKDGIAGLWEYTCIKNNGAVLGASTTSLQEQISSMRNKLYELLEQL